MCHLRAILVLKIVANVETFTLSRSAKPTNKEKKKGKNFTVAWSAVNGVEGEFFSLHIVTP